MNIHIVISEHTSDWILARLARHLMKHNGWTASNRPNAKADANLFFPYIDHKFTRNFHATPIVGFMTHYESTVEAKVNIWKRTAPKFDLRVTMAEMYNKMLTDAGHVPTVNITPPVEVDKFTLKPLPRHDKPVIGVSGRVYPGGRKGESLLLRLKRYNSHRWVMTAAGRDWPMKCTNYPWVGMQKFYWSLDVFLCTSIIEGGPVTILEALACGRPVVVPEHVGIVDELPDMDGIFRYKAGDYKSMVAAIEKALLGDYAAANLRALVVKRTPERYALDWRELMEAFLDHPKTLEVSAIEAPWTWQNSGVFIVAYGRKARDCAYHLTKSIHAIHPELQCAVVSDEPVGPEDVFVKSMLKDKRARSQKTHIWDLAPANWQYVLYVDADTLVVKPLNAFFDILQDGWDMVMTLSPPRGALIHHAQREKYKEENSYTNGVLDSNKWLQMAGGVWAFQRNARTERFLSDFHLEWKRYQHTDQQGMMRALFGSPVKFWTLPREWNWFAHHDAPNKDAVILHFATAARAWTEKHPGRKLWREWTARLQKKRKAAGSD